MALKNRKTTFQINLCYVWSGTNKILRFNVWLSFLREEALDQRYWCISVETTIFKIKQLHECSFRFTKYMGQRTSNSHRILCRCCNWRIDSFASMVICLYNTNRHRWDSGHNKSNIYHLCTQPHHYTDMYFPMLLLSNQSPDQPLRLNSAKRDISPYIPIFFTLIKVIFKKSNHSI